MYDNNMVNKVEFFIRNIDTNSVNVIFELKT